MAILRNDILEVEVDETNLAVKVTDRRSGEVWTTPGPGFELQVYNVVAECLEWHLSNKGEKKRDWLDRLESGGGQVSVRKQDDTRAECRVDYANMGLGFTVQFYLSGPRLEVVIPADSWDYSGETFSEVMCVDCLPLFGGRPRGSEGYMVLPHGGGCLRYFADHPARVEAMKEAIRKGWRTVYASEKVGSPPNLDAPQSYPAMVYGWQEKWQEMIAYPLWGTVVGQAGWAAYVPFGAGDADTSVVTSANRGKERLCGVHARFHYRHHPRDVRVDEDRKLVLTFLNKPGLDYAEIGKVYRQYLREEAGIPTLREKCDASPQGDYLAGAYYLRPMTGMKRYAHIGNPHPDGKGILDIYMTFDDIAAELRRLKQAGVKKALVQIVGFNHEGHDGNYPAIFPINEACGGEEKFRQLLKTIKELGYQSSVHINLRSHDRASREFKIGSLVKDRYGGVAVNSSGPGGENFHACPVVARRDFVPRNFPRLKDIGLDGGIYIDFVLGVLYCCHDPRHSHALTRRAYLNGVRGYIEDAQKIFGSVRTECLIAPLLDIVQAIGRITSQEHGANYLRAGELCQRGLVDKTVPLQAIIFHGFVLYATGNTCLGVKDYWKHILHTLAIGGIPMEQHRGPQPQWDDLHVLEYKLFCEYMKWLRFEFMESYKEIGEVTQTTYSDGTIVWVNHGAEEAEVDGQKLPGRSFWVKPGTAGHKELRMSEDRSITDREPADYPDGWGIWGAGCYPAGRRKKGAPGPAKTMMEGTIVDLE